MAVYVTSDLHGTEPEKLIQLLKKVDFCKTQLRKWFLFVPQVSIKLYQVLGL